MNNQTQYIANLVTPRRLDRSFRHAEAFHLMHYRCECGNHEMLWNSRDGVTPFTVPCDACNDPMGLCHVDFHLDRRCIYFMAPKGMRYFTNMTRPRAREKAVAVIDHLVSEGRVAEADRNAKIAALSDTFYGDGTEPDLVVA